MKLLLPVYSNMQTAVRDVRENYDSPGDHPPSYTLGIRSYVGVKQLVRGVDHPPPSSAKVKERVELYFYSSSGPS